MPENKPSWDLRDPRVNSHSLKDALERQTAHRLIVSLRGYAIILKDISKSMPDGDEKTDVLYVAGRLERTIPALEEAIRKVVPEISQGQRTRKK